VYSQTAFGITRTQLSLAYGLGTITSSFLLPYAGTLIDRWGARIMMVISSVGLAAGLLLLANISFATRTISTPAIAIAITATCFLVIRFFGQGNLTIVSRMAIGWRGAYLFLAVMIGIGMSVLGWAFYRDNPEQCGLIMDGREINPGKKKRSAAFPETMKQFTRGETLRTVVFWTYSLVLAWQALFITAVSFHITSIGAEVGLDRNEALQVFIIVGIVSAATNVFIGWLSDYIRLKWILLVCIICQVITSLGLINFSNDISRYAFGIACGISGGCFGLLITVAYPRFFGREHLGAISGVTMFILVFASAVGPFMFSWLRDITENFQMAFIISAILPAVMFIPGLFAKNPQANIELPSDQ